jgi:hypothetical protein
MERVPPATATVGAGGAARPVEGDPPPPRLRLADSKELECERGRVGCEASLGKVWLLREDVVGAPEVRFLYCSERKVVM